MVAARFVHPATALQEFREQKIALVPPQFYLLTTLAEILKGTNNTVEQRAKVERLATGPFGRLAINPKRLPKETEGRAVLTYEGDETRGGLPGRLHRSLVIWKKNGVNMLQIRSLDVLLNYPDRLPRISYCSVTSTYSPKLKNPPFKLRNYEVMKECIRTRIIL